MAWLAILGLAMALLPGRCRRTSLLWLPLLLYLGIIYAVGDSVSRYLQPIEWTVFVLMAFGLDTIMDGLQAIWGHIRHTPSPARTEPEDHERPAGHGIPC
jgi:hypothetical protein